MNWRPALVDAAVLGEDSSYKNNRSAFGSQQSSEYGLCLTCFEDSAIGLIKNEQKEYTSPADYSRTTQMGKKGNYNARSKEM